MGIDKPMTGNFPASCPNCESLRRQLAEANESVALWKGLAEMAKTAAEAAASDRDEARGKLDKIVEIINSGGNLMVTGANILWQVTRLATSEEGEGDG